MVFKGISDEEKAIIQYFIDNSDKLKDGTYDKTKATKYFNWYWSRISKEDYEIEDEKDIISRLKEFSKNKYIYKKNEVWIDIYDEYYHDIFISKINSEKILFFRFKYLEDDDKWLLDTIYDDDPYKSKLF